MHMQDYILKTNKDGSVITLRDVQLKLLAMAKDLDKLCRKNNIPYFLSGGSALGAVRHQGFIPWDDDYDIAMLREDYLRFQKALDKDLDKSKYLYQCFEKDDRYNVLIPAMKIRLRGTYVKEANVLLRNKCDYDGKDSDGLFIDVFVFDYCSNNYLVDLPFRLFNYSLMPLMIGLDNVGINPVGLKKTFLNDAKLYGQLNKKSKYIGFDLTWTFKNPTKPFIFKYEDIYPTQYVKFEDTALPIAHDPNRYLNVAIAPSWRKLPPEKEQAPKHIVDIKL